MEILKILEWNINQRSTGTRIASYIGNETIKRDPDIIVLIEFKDDINHFNTESLNDLFSDYYINYYDGTQDTDTMRQRNTTGNGILIALKKKRFNKPSNVESPSMSDDTNLPNWLRIKASLLSGKEVTITGIRVKRADENKADLQSRKNQIQWILDENNKISKTDNQIIIGDLNYGPHRTEWDKKVGLNWQDIIYMIRDYNYCKSDNEGYSPYAPKGLSWGNERLDLLITSGVRVVTNSKYNALDWSFGMLYDKKTEENPSLTKEYINHDGFLIKTATGNPDHAIFTAELSLK